MPRIFGSQIARAEQAAELAVAIEAFVVHFHDEDVVESGENIFQPGGERIDVLDVNGGNAVARSARAVDRFADRPLASSPSPPAGRCLPVDRRLPASAS